MRIRIFTLGVPTLLAMSAIGLAPELMSLRNYPARAQTPTGAMTSGELSLVFELTWDWPPTVAPHNPHLY